MSEGPPEGAAPALEEAGESGSNCGGMVIIIAATVAHNWRGFGNPPG